MTLPWVVLTLALVAPQGPSFATPSRPFSRLFELPTVGQAAVMPARMPDVVCGTVILRPDAAMDDRMPRVTPPTDRHFTLRVERPSICTSPREDGPR